MTLALACSDVSMPQGYGHGHQSGLHPFFTEAVAISRAMLAPHTTCQQARTEEILLVESDAGHDLVLD